MNIGIAIAAHAEGFDLEATVALCLASDPPPHVVVIVDDESPSNISMRSAYSRMKMWEKLYNVKCIYNETRRGTTISKGIAVAACFDRGCDAVVILDSHMRFAKDWLDDVENALLAHPDTVFCAACRGFERKAAFIGCGGTFETRNHAPEPVWLPNTQINGQIDFCPSVLGACYFFNAKTWRAMGQMSSVAYGWGGDEADLSLRAWLTGHSVKRHHGLIVQHNFKHLNGSFASWEPFYNKMVLCATLFEDGVFERVYETKMRETYPKEAIAAFDRNREAIAQERQAFRPLVTRKDYELEELNVWSHPSEGRTPHGTQLEVTRHPLVTTKCSDEKKMRILESIDKDPNRLVVHVGADALSYDIREHSIHHFFLTEDAQLAGRIGRNAMHGSNIERLCEWVRLTYRFENATWIINSEQKIDITNFLKPKDEVFIY